MKINFHRIHSSLNFYHSHFTMVIKNFVLTNIFISLLYCILLEEKMEIEMKKLSFQIFFITCNLIFNYYDIRDRFFFNYHFYLCNLRDPLNQLLQNGELKRGSINIHHSSSKLPSSINHKQSQWNFDQ